MPSFRVTCLTCGASLRVRDASAIGKILPCPKCNSMVEVVGPEDIPTDDSAAENAPLEETATGGDELQQSAAATATLATSDIIGQFPAMPKPVWPKWLAIGSAGTVAAAALIGIIFFVIGGDGSDNEKANAVASVDAEITSEVEETDTATTTETETDVHDPEERAAASEEDATGADGPFEKDVDPFGTDTLNSNTLSAAVDLPEGDQPKTETEAPVDNKKGIAKEGIAANPPQDIAVPFQTNVGASRIAATDNDEPGASSSAAQTPSANPAEPVRAPIPPADIDVTARLSMRLADAKFRKVPLANFVTTLSTMSAVPIRYDAATLSRVGHTPDDQIQVQLQDASIGDVLSEAIGQWGLTYLATGPRVIIRVPSPDEADLRTVRHDVRDLADNAAELDQLAENLQAVVAPKTWATSGGRGQIVAASGVLTVEQSSDVHFQILVFGDKLRVARRLAPKSPLDPSHFQLKTREQLSEEMLARTVTIRPAEGETLNTIAERLSHNTGLMIAVDELALMKVGKSGDDEVRIEIDKEPLSDAFAVLLTPRDLTFRIVDHRIIEITTPAAVATAYHVEFYPVAELATDRETAGRLIDRVKRQVVPDSWSTVGGSGAIVFDDRGRCLIVRQTSAGHTELASFLKN